MYSDYTVKVVFEEQETGSIEYEFPHVNHITDPKEGMKATVIGGTRGDGSIVIPGGKRSQEIIVRGTIFDSDGYKDLTTLINDMKSKVTTELATLTLKHKEGASYVTDWNYSVRRIDEIDFPQSYRTGSQKYEVSFLVVAY